MEKMPRIKKFRKANEIAVKKGYEKSGTGMYRVEDSGEIEPPMNCCAICLFLEDDPENYGDVITPTSYDGDCDECLGESRPYATGDNDPDTLVMSEQSMLDLMYTPADFPKKE